MTYFLAGVTLTVHRNGGSDRYGNPLPGSDHTVDGCALAPAGSAELVDGRETVIDQDTAYGPYDADVLAQDTIVVPSGQSIPAGTYQVDGSPARFVNPFTGDQSGTVVRLTRATG